MADDIVTRLSTYVCLGGYECLCPKCELLSDAIAEICRLRDAGDDLLAVARGLRDCTGQGIGTVNETFAAWQEARRG